MDKYKIISKAPVAQCTVDLTDIKKNMVSLDKAAGANVPETEDRVAEVIGPVAIMAKEKVEKIADKIKELEEAYKTCAEFYCEDPKRQQSDEIGKKILNCLYFICKTEETVNQL